MQHPQRRLHWRPADASLCELDGRTWRRQSALGLGPPSGARHRADWQLCDVRRNFPGLGQPNLVAVAKDVLHGTPELPQAEWLAQEEGVEHERADQRLALV